MKKATSAYSVLALILLVGYTLTLAVHPASVFAQAEITPSANDDEVVELSAEDDSVDESGVAEEVAQEEAAAAVSSENALKNHPYKVDQLRGDRVYGDFVVGPGRFQLEVAPGESKTVEILVTNRMGIPKTFLLTTEDMDAQTDEGGGVRLLGDEVGPYSIKDFISVPQESFILEHQQRARIPVTVSIPADAQPGGFYGTLLTQIISEDATSDSPGVVAGAKLVSRIGTLFFVTTPGDIERESEIMQFSTVGDKRFFTKGPIELSVVTENKGTVHVTPFGELSIFNTLGNEVGYVELQPWYVLPQSIRNKDIEWNREFLWGRYTAVLELNRGYDNIVDTVSYTFWVIPLQLVAIVFGGFFIFFLLIRFFFSQFEFKRKTK